MADRDLARNAAEIAERIGGTALERGLNVAPEPVVNARCAVQMAEGCADLLSADLAVAVTGVGGRIPRGHQPGTVYVALSSAKGDVVDQYKFDGEPSEVVAEATVVALEPLLASLSGR